MKRWLSALIAVATLFSSTACSAAAQSRFAPGNFSSFSLSSELLTSPLTVDQQDNVAVVSDLLSTTLKPESKPDVSISPLVTFSISESGGSVAQYDIIAQSEKYYVSNGDTIRGISSDKADSLLLMLDRISRETLDFAKLPTAYIKLEDKNHEMKLETSSYAYKSISGRWFKAAARPPIAEKPNSVLTTPVTGFSVSIPPDELKASIVNPTETVWEGNAADIGAFMPVREGSYTINLTAGYKTDHSPNYYSGEITWTFPLSWSLPVSFTVLGEDSFPGELVVLRAHNIPEGQNVVFESGLSASPVFFSDGAGGKLALLPLATVTQVGEYPFTLSCGDVSASYIIKAQNKQFQIQDMTVSASTADETINSSKANEEYERIINPLRSVASETGYWEESFTWPVTGRISTEFGMIRYINGSPTSTRHNAIDFAVPKGTPVAAANNGKILYAGFLQLTGNTVLIEHGYGLKSWYYHMDSLSCETGQIVKRGDIIGKVGSTGFSTGPHLHFGMSVGRTFVNPGTIIDTDLLVGLLPSNAMAE